MKKTSKRPTAKATKAPKHAAKRVSARAPAKRASRDEMRAEYDFSGGVRGKYAGRFTAGSNVVVLDPDVAAAFPTGRAVNAALRRAIAAARATKG